jgi:hypothetical protein
MADEFAQAGRSDGIWPEFYFTPELRLKDGRVFRDIEDALSFAREQEARPGVDQRDEVLHKMERSPSPASSRG